MRLGPSKRRALSVGALLVTCSTCAAFSTATSDARADGDAAADTAANARFNEGRAFVDRGDFIHACPKFAESERLAPSGRAVFNLGDCYEHLGKYASALAAFEDALDRARSAHRADIAELSLKRVVAVSSKVSRLIPDGGQGVALRMDGVLIVLGNLGPEGLAVDPGEHTVTASAPGKKPWTKTVFFSDERTTLHVAVPDLEDAATDSKTTTGPVSGGVSNGNPPDHADTNAFPYRTVGIASGSAGLVTIGVGIALGLAASSRLDHVRAVCPNGQCASASDLGVVEPDLDAAHGLATASTACIIAGSVIAAAGVTLAIVAPFGGPAKKMSQLTFDGRGVRFITQF